jgi:hypothetical protein
MSAPGRAVGGAPDRAREGADLSSVVVAIFVIAGALAAGILAADAAILVVAGASGLMLAVAIVLRPDIATLTTVAILYSNAAVVAVRFHGVPFFVGAFVPLLLVVPLARDLVVRRLPIVAPPMLGWMVVLLLIYLLSALFSIDTTTSWDAVVIFLVEGFGLYFLLVNVIRTPEMLRLTTWVLLASGALVSIPAIHQVLTENYDFMYFGFAQADSAIRTGVTTLTGEVLQPRMAGPIGETNRFAQVMLMLVPLGLFRVIGETSLGLRVLAGLMTVAVTLGVVLSFSRGGAVGLVALVAALVVLRMVRLRYVLVVLLVLAVIVVSFPQYFDRVTSLVAGFGSEAPASEVDNSLLSRATESLAAALVMVDHPIIGVGPGMFPVFYEEYANVVGHPGSDRVPDHRLPDDAHAAQGAPGEPRASARPRAIGDAVPAGAVHLLRDRHVPASVVRPVLLVDAGGGWGRGDHHVARGRRRPRPSRGSGRRDPVRVAEVLAGARRRRAAVDGPIPPVDEPRLPLVVAFGRPARAGVQEAGRTEQSPVRPVPRVVAGDAQQLRLEDGALEGLPCVAGEDRRPGEGTAAAHLLGLGAVDVDAVLRAAGRVDAHGPGRVALP